MRKLSQLTQQEMANKLGFHDVREYGRIEQGEKRLTIDLMDHVAQIFDMTLVELLNFDKEVALHGHGTEEPGTGTKGELVQELRARIAHLEDEVAFLREELRRR